MARLPFRSSPAPPARSPATATSAGRTTATRARRVVRSWIILAVIALVYFGWTLTIYFLEPGLR